MFGQILLRTAKVEMISFWRDWWKHEDDGIMTGNIALPYQQARAKEPVMPDFIKRLFAPITELLSPERGLVEPICRRILKFIIFAIYRPKALGLENIPATGGVVLIANHVSYLDGPIISAICPRPVRYVIDKHIYEQPIINFFMRHARAIPILPKKEVVEAALDEISRALKNGEVVCIFPEGRLTYTGHIGRFKPGIEYMIQRDPVPVVPMALDGLWGSIFSRKYLKAPMRFLPRSLKADVRLVIGFPVVPEKVKVDKLQRVTLKLLLKARTDFGSYSHTK